MIEEVCPVLLGGPSELLKIPLQELRVLKRQLELYDEVTKKYLVSNPLFKEIIQSQLAFAKRATQWELDYITNRKMAHDHYFGPNAKSPI